VSEIAIRKCAGYAGAEIAGVDLANLSDKAFATVRAALFEHGVIFFRDQELSPEHHIALAERFGKIDINRFFKAVEGYPQIAEVRTEPDQRKVIGDIWHSDHSYDPAPAMASILVARELPPFGGDTLFASATAAYRHLSDGLRETLEGLSAWHSDGSFANFVKDGRISDEGITKPNLHPMVIRHPATGEKALFVNRDFTLRIDGWTDEESKPLLNYLYDFITRPAFTCRFQWAPGSVAMWDNRLVQHYAIADYHGQRRLMHRITLEGVPLS